MAGDKRVDKRVYNYRTALEQPMWIQQLSKRFTLTNAVKLSTIVWTVFVFSLYLWLVSSFILKVVPIPLIFWITLGSFPSWSLGIILSDLTIEHQPVVRYIRDTVFFYLTYGKKRKTYFINDGLLYVKPEIVLKKERTLNGIKQRNR